MNVIICIALALLALWGGYYSFVTLEDGLLGTGFGGLFFVLVLYTIQVAINDFTGRSKEEE